MNIQSGAPPVQKIASGPIKLLSKESAKPSLPDSFALSSTEDLLFGLGMFLPTTLVGGAVGYAKGGVPGAFAGAAASTLLSWPAAGAGTFIGGTVIDQLTGDAECATKGGLATGLASGVAAMVGGGYLAALATNSLLA